MSQSAEDRRARLLAEVARTPSPTRAVYNRNAAVIAALGVVATAAAFFAMGGPRRGSRPNELVAFSASFGLVAAVVLRRVSSGAGGSMLGRPRAVLLTAVALTAPLLGLAAVAAALTWPGAASEPVTLGVDLACGAMTVAQGALPLVALLLPRRGSDPVHPAITGAALGMTAGAWAVVMAYLRCPHAAMTHALLAHVAPTLALAALGAALGGWLLRVRAD
jgi:hypothetical protein